MSYLLYSSVFELSRGKTLVFPRLNLFLEPQLSSQMSSCSVMSLLLILLLKIFKKTLDTPFSSFPLQPAQRATGRTPLRPPSLDLLRGRRAALQLLYDGPYDVIRRGGHSFTLQVGTREEIVAVSRLKACTAADTAPGSPSPRG
jgi:hypothetical protein